MLDKPLRGGFLDFLKKSPLTLKPIALFFLLMQHLLSMSQKPVLTLYSILTDETKVPLARERRKERRMSKILQRLIEEVPYGSAANYGSGTGINQSINQSIHFNLASLT